MENNSKSTQQSTEKTLFMYRSPSPPQEYNLLNNRSAGFYSPFFLQEKQTKLLQKSNMHRIICVCVCVCDEEEEEGAAAQYRKSHYNVLELKLSITEN